MDMKQTALAIVLGVAVIFAYRILKKRNKDGNSNINLDDLLLGDDGKASKAAFILFGSFLLSSWVVINMTLAGKLTDIIFGAYMAVWVTPTVTRLIVGGKAPDDKPSKPV